MTCFIDHIGLAYCEPGVYNIPSSGIYLKSLPGISIESIDKIADSEQVTYLGVWDDVQTSALAQFKLDVINEMANCYQISKDCDYDALICENIEELTLAWKYLLGVWLMIFRLSTDRLNFFTTIDREQARELKDFYQLEYEKSLKQGVQLMNTDSCKLCCGGNPQVVTWLP
jgi:hypothetical protein